MAEERQADTGVVAAAGRVLQTPRIRSVDRAAVVLKALAGSDEPLSVSDLASSCDLSRTTVWRLLVTLEHHALVYRDSDTQRFGIGSALRQGGSSVDYWLLVRRLHPLLARVTRETGETSTLAVAQGFNLICIDQVDPPGVPVVDWLGRALPLHATSTGKAFLARIAGLDRAAALHEPFEMFTDRTITDRAALDQELERVRDLGYATCIGEYAMHSNGVAVAVQDPQSRAMVVVSIWGPEGRVAPDRLGQLGRRCLAAASEIVQSSDPSAVSSHSRG
jgi:DNA-binding IclR family transcriptional regulator